jgi:VCBS repeat-containing protein
LKIKETESTTVGQEIRNTIEPPILGNNETDLEQTIDTRLLLNNKNHTTAEEFTTMIRGYNTYGNSTINEVGAYIINRAECRYKTKNAYQNAVRAERTKMNFQITSADLTPAYTPAASLAMTDVPDHSINAVRLQTNTKKEDSQCKISSQKDE